MQKSHLKLVTPTEVLRTVTPSRRWNAEIRTREHLTPGRGRGIGTRVIPRGLLSDPTCARANIGL